MKSKKYEKFIRDTNEPIALFCGLDINGLGVVRSLGRQGIPVIGLDPNSKQIGLFSRYCKAATCPDPKNEEEYINFLLNIGKLINVKGVIFQGSDAHTISILEHREELEKYYRFPMAKLDVIDKLMNKRKFYETLEKLDMPHPKTYFPNNISEVKQISKEITYPYIVKPIFSTDFNKKFGIKVFKVNSEEELVKAYNKATSSGHEVVIQEVIPGSDTNLHLVGAYLNHVSEPLGIFTFRRIRQYPHVFGNGALCESVLVPEIAELCTSFLKKIKYHGIIDAELKRDPRDNKFKFIEINPRTGWQNRLAAKCGVNLPYMAYRDAIGKDVEKVISQKEGIKWLYMFNDLRSSFESLSKGELSLTEYINSLRGEKEYAIFAWDDPLPFFVSLFNLCSTVLMYSLRHSISYVKSVVRK